MAPVLGRAMNSHRLARWYALRATPSATGNGKRRESRLDGFMKIEPVCRCAQGNCHGHEKREVGDAVSGTKFVAQHPCTDQSRRHRTREAGRAMDDRAACGIRF